jgi:hypothetical protein
MLPAKYEPLVADACDLCAAADYFGRVVADTSWDVSPKNFIITACIAGSFWIAFFVRMVWVRRTVYHATGGRRDLRF